ncbi:unnamed protein product [Eruca vesicaria subsp. sativa]|uniref:Transmembrane protein n=1 Tax=Eruca vesicaria subsp. sativa TaxID=29727 RepID=A0ABC8KM17_ERUVS|nr:unnamed protein product [Eruca vesicaria subsp. sativa]
MKMVDKTDEEKHFSWCYFLFHLPLLFFFLAFLCFLSSYGLSSLLVTMVILFISTFVFFVRFFKKKTRGQLVDRSQKEATVDDAASDNDNIEEEEDGLIEILLVNEEAETIAARRNINQSRQRIRVGEDEQEEIDDVIMEEEDNLIEIDISIGSIKRRSK